MTTGYRNASGVDFDSLFDPYVQGTPPAATGLRLSTGVDLAGRFAPISYGSKGPDVGFRTSAGLDVSNLWAAYGTAGYGLPIAGQTFFAHSSGNVSAAMLSSVVVNINADGSYSVVTTGNSSPTPTASGTWLPTGQAASDYQVQFTVTLEVQRTTGPATITNGAATYSACTSNRVVSGSAQVGQHSAQDQGGTYDIQIALKRVSSGAVSITHITADIQSVGTG